MISPPDPLRFFSEGILDTLTYQGTSNNWLVLEFIRPCRDFMSHFARIPATFVAG